MHFRSYNNNRPKKKKHMNYSAELQNVIDDLGLKKENILYLPIAQVHLDRIREGSKTIEFREPSDFYLRKLAKFDKDGNFIEMKPLTHILFQGGYNPESPRMLIEFTNVLEKFEKVENPEEPETIKLLAEAEKEGFSSEDVYLGLFLGKIKYDSTGVK